MKKKRTLFRALGLAAIVAFAVVSCETEVPTEYVPQTSQPQHVYHTVTFNTGHGSAVGSVEVRSGLALAMPANPIKSYHVFAGWYTNAELTTRFAPATPITSPITLFARWVACECDDCDETDCECDHCTSATCGCETTAANCNYADCDCGTACVGATCDCTEQQLRSITVEIADGITMTMNRIRAGTFMRGGQHGEWDATPVHQVTLTRGFYMGIHPVTREQFQAVMGANPSTSGGTLAPGEVQGRWPVDTVNWYHAVAFANRLSVMEGLTPVYHIPGIDWATLEFADIPTTGNATWNAVTADWTANGFRLATEAEWEFAARAGTTTQWSFGDTDAYIDYYAWTGGNFGGRTHQVGQLRPNPWGLYDMHGNVWEWVWDWFGAYASVPKTDPTGVAAGVGRVKRGGCWGGTSAGARSAARNGTGPGQRYNSLGFRLVLP